MICHAITCLALLCYVVLRCVGAVLCYSTLGFAGPDWAKDEMPCHLYVMSYLCHVNFFMLNLYVMLYDASCCVRCYAVLGCYMLCYMLCHYLFCSVLLC